MMAMAVVMAAAEGCVLWTVTAFSVTVVPLDRSRPSCTRKLLCHLAGWNASLPRIPTSMTMMRAASTARARPGLDLVLLGGATSRLSFDRSGQRRRYGFLIRGVPVVRWLLPEVRLRLRRGVILGAVLGQDVHDGPAHDPDLDARRDLELQVLAVDRRDGAVDACGSRDPLARRDLALGLLRPALPIALRPDEQHVDGAEEHDDYQDGRVRPRLAFGGGVCHREKHVPHRRGFLPLDLPQRPPPGRHR